jgi:5'-deoxynucleotidase YfbR-like HD superfamily hydrolase
MSKYILPTYTGRLFDLENPTEDMICIEDIAHHLSLENRYNGATKFPYSVGQHSLLVCQMAPLYMKLEALLHDREEAYYKDWTSPLKNMVNFWTSNHSRNIYEDIISEFTRVSRNKFGLKLEFEDETKNIIKEIDLRMASTEILQLFWDYHPKYWQHSYKDYPGYDIKIYEQCPSTVEQMFKEEYQKWRRD